MSDSFIDFDDELDQSDRFERPIEEGKKEVRQKVWRRTGNGKWGGERGLEDADNEQFAGAGLCLSRLRSTKRLRSFEEADLVRAYRAGEKAAGDRLIESLIWLVRGIAGNQPKYRRKFYGPSFDDKVAAGLSGAWDALQKYDLGRNTRLSTYAVHWIMKAIDEECQRWRYRGMGGQTTDRYLFSHVGDPDIDAAKIAAKAKCSLESAEEAIARLDVKELPYDHSEKGCAENGRRTLVLVERGSVEVHPRGHIVTDED